jgi:predicted membrane protein
MSTPTPIDASRSRSGFLLGILVVLLGIGLLLGQMGIIDGDKLIRFWPLLLIVAGIGRIIELRRNPHRAIWGVLFLCMGIVLQLQELNFHYFRLQTLWPVFLIAAGLWIVLNSFVPRSSSGRAPGGNWSDYFQGRFQMDSSGSDLNAVAVFGGVKRNITTKKFRSGRLTAIMGGIEIDFIDADIDGEEAILDATAILGGIEIRVPDNWHVSFEAVALLAGTSDERRRGPAPNPGVTPKHLIIRGAAVLAGVNVKN